MQRYIALLKVIEVGSFTKAADLLGYTQPALSQMIASLEKELGVSPIHRSQSELRDHETLRKLGIPMPKLLDSAGCEETEIT